MDVARQGQCIPNEILHAAYSKKGSEPSNAPNNDLNMACLRSVVKLLDRLQLLTADPSSTGDDVVHVVSRLFNKYSTALLTSIETCQYEAPVSTPSFCELCLFKFPFHIDIRRRVRTWLHQPSKCV